MANTTQLTLKEAAVYLSVSPWQVLQYAREGKLPRHYINKSNKTGLMFQENDLKGFVAHKGAGMERPLTTKEVAEFLNVIPDTVRDYISSGKLKAHKMGNGTHKKGSKRQWRIMKDDLMYFLQGKRKD